MAQIKMVVLWSNGMVLAFDERGEQVPECQGRLLVVREKLRDLVGEWLTAKRQVHTAWIRVRLAAHPYQIIIYGITALGISVKLAHIRFNLKLYPGGWNAAFLWVH